MVTMYKLLDPWGRIRYVEDNEKLFLSRLKRFIVDGREWEAKYGGPGMNFKSRADGFKLVDNEWVPVVLSESEIKIAIDKRQEREAKKKMRRRGY